MTRNTSKNLPTVRADANRRGSPSPDSTGADPVYAPPAATKRSFRVDSSSASFGFHPGFDVNRDGGLEMKRDLLLDVRCDVRSPEAQVSTPAIRPCPGRGGGISHEDSGTALMIFVMAPAKRSHVSDSSASRR